jgi:Zn-dependent peptidase ImmA (M78 family)/transcriptional regulator with XRE-family HTH domain
MAQLEKTDFIIPVQLKKARDAIGISIGEAASLSSVQPGDLECWERGVGGPDADQLWNLAETYSRPIHYFFIETPEPPPMQDFRVQATTFREAIDPSKRGRVVASFEELCRAQQTLEGMLGYSRKVLIDRQRYLLNDPDKLAYMLRQDFHLSTKPIDNLRDLLESWGIKVFAVDIPVEELSGMSWWHNVYGPAMLLNRQDVETRRNFTMAHELLHLLKLSAHVFCDLNAEVGEEVFANSFAASFLMPREHLTEFVQPLIRNRELAEWETDKSAIGKVARCYKVSLEAASWRLENFELLPFGYTQANKTAWRYHPRSPRGPRWRRRVKGLGKTYSSLVDEAYGKGLVSLSAVAAMLQIDVVQVSEWAQSRKPDGG